MKKSIYKSVSKLVFVVIFFSLINLTFQVLQYYIITQKIKRTQGILKIEHSFYEIADNLQKIEIGFLHYNLGYIPSFEKYEYLMKKNENLIKNFTQISSDNINKKQFKKLEKICLNMDKNILKYLSLKQKNLQKELLLKDINESFFISRQLVLEQRKLFRNKMKEKVVFSKRLIKFVFIMILGAILLIIFTTVYMLLFRKFLLKKIEFINNTIKSFSLKNLKDFKQIEYPETDELKSVFNTFNNLLQTIYLQNKEIQFQEKKYKYFFNNSKDAFMILDPKKGIIDSNPEGLKMFGFKNRDEFLDIVPIQPLELFPEFQKDGSLSSKKAKKIILEGLKQNFNKFEWICLKKDGSTFEASILMSKIKIGKNVVFVVTIRDITQEKIEQKKQIQAQKMESIGTLAGGIAHDFNNMLAGIMGAAQLLQFPKFNLDKNALKYVDMILKSSQRAKDLTSKLLAFGRKSNFLKQEVELHKIIDDVVNILKRTIDKKIDLKVENKAENDLILGDTSSLENMLLNLGINASHAMPNGGRLQIETQNIILDSNFCKKSMLKISEGKYIEIKVKDSGIGIAKENLNKIFEPFFTTKKLGKGTGLGLASVYGAIQEHKGTIKVESEENKGTVFIIYLPLIEKDKKNKQTAKTQEKQKQYLFSGTALLVDDEEIIRTTQKYIFEELGFNVLLAKNGIEAVEIFKANKNKIKIIMLDMLMPKMNGKEAFFKIKEIDKNAKIILSSGFFDDSIEELQKAGLSASLKKPFEKENLEDLLKKLNLFD